MFIFIEQTVALFSPTVVSLPILVTGVNSGLIQNVINQIYKHMHL